MIIIIIVAVLSVTILMGDVGNLETEIPSNSTYSIHASDIITDLDG